MSYRLDKTGRTLTERLGAARLQSRDITELIGICKGVLADGVVNLFEAMFILQWLEDHKAVVATWPACVLYDTLDAMLEDEQLSNEQEGELLDLLVEITGTPIRIEMKITTASGEILDSIERNMQTPTSLPINEPSEGLFFPQKSFVLTGNFMYGPRKVCEEAVKSLGGLTQKGVTKSTDYLVIGEVGSESWAHSAFGRKIEKAVCMRDSGHKIHIVRESTWTKHLGL